MGEKNRGIVFSGYNIPRNLDTYDLAVYLVPEASSFGKYMNMVGAWNEMIDSGVTDKLVEILNKYDVEDATFICICSFASLFRFDKFWRTIEKENPVFKKIKEDYFSTVKVLDAMAKRRKTTIIVGDVAKEPNNIIGRFFKERHQNKKPAKKNSRAVVVSGIKQILVPGGSGVRVLAINGSRLLEYNHREEIKNSDLAFISRIGDGIHLPDWINLEKVVFMADDVVNGVIHVGNYSVTFDF